MSGLPLWDPAIALGSRASYLFGNLNFGVLQPLFGQVQENILGGLQDLVCVEFQIHDLDSRSKPRLFTMLMLYSLIIYHITHMYVHR